MTFSYTCTLYFSQIQLTESFPPLLQQIPILCVGVLVHVCACARVCLPVSFTWVYCRSINLISEEHKTFPQATVCKSSGCGYTSSSQLQSKAPKSPVVYRLSRLLPAEFECAAAMLWPQVSGFAFAILFIHLFICPSVCLSIHLSISFCLSVSIYSSTCLCLSVCLSIHYLGCVMLC